jgi:hypothetical protein
LSIHTNRHQAGDTGAACPFDNPVKISVVAFVIEMTMTVEQFHFFPLDWGGPF